MFCHQCGTSISQTGNFCPSCGISITGNRDYASNQPTQEKPTPVQALDSSIHSGYPTGPGQLSQMLRIALVVGSIVFFFLLLASGDSNIPTPAPLPPPQVEVASTNASPVAPTPAATPSATPPVVTTPPVSLANGTILKSRSAYLSGGGELKIRNGTNEDAVAKLIIDGTSVFTVYIKANSSYTMKNITDGTYWLAFAHGTDWDKEDAIFRRGASYSSFEETFDFETTETQYTIFEVTLNAVVGGNAETETVNSAQFNAY